MIKGKFGLSTAAMAVMAFAFAALRQSVPVLLITGFALLAEKDEWQNKQVLQALLLTVVYNLSDLAVDLVLGGVSVFFGWLKLYGVSGAINTVNSVVSYLIYIALIAACVLAILRNLRGRDAALPVISKMAGSDLTAAFMQKARTQTPPAQYAQPGTAAPMQAPPAQASPVKSSPPSKFCTSCGAPLSGDSAFCNECGAKIG